MPNSWLPCNTNNVPGVTYLLVEVMKMGGGHAAPMGSTLRAGNLWAGGWLYCCLQLPAPISLSPLALALSLNSFRR